MHRLPVSTASAAGRYCLRTAELTPSAPTSRSASACRPSAKCSRTPSWPASYRTSSEPKTSLHQTAASTSRNVWWLTEVDEVAGAYGSAADPVLLCSLRMRSRSLTTVSRVLASSQVAWNTAKDSGGRHCSSAPSGPSVDVQLVALPPDGQVRG